MTPEWLDYIKDFEVHDSDCFVTGYPKSGTTWLQEIVYLIHNQDDLDKRLEAPNYSRVPLLDLESSERKKYILNQKDPQRMFKTHLLCEQLPSQLWEKLPKIVHIYRNPKDIAVSFFHLYRESQGGQFFTGTWSEFFKLFITGTVAYGSWPAYMSQWCEHKNDRNILFVRYENLIEDPASSVQNIATFFGKPLQEDKLQKLVNKVSFESMRDNPMTNGILGYGDIMIPCQRKGIVGDWKNYFTVAQNKEFNEWLDKEMTNIDIDNLGGRMKTPGNGANENKNIKNGGS